MKNFTLSAVFLVLLYMATAANAMACSCLPPSLDYFWDVISPSTKNAMVRFEELVQAEPIDGLVYGRFVVLENYNNPELKVNDIIILNSGITTCDFYIPYMRTGDTLIVALLYGSHRLFAGCTFNFLEVRGGYAEGKSLEEIRARILTITSSSKDLVARNNLILYPNPASFSLTVKVPYTGQYPCKIEILDMSGRVVKTKETDSAEESLDIQNLQKGMYLLRLSFNGTKTIMQKWVKA